jgi:hypothetical protein
LGYSKGGCCTSCSASSSSSAQTNTPGVEFFAYPMNFQNLALVIIPATFEEEGQGNSRDQQQSLATLLEKELVLMKANFQELLLFPASSVVVTLPQQTC